MRIAVVMWPDTFEDWYERQGVDRRSYLDGYQGEWAVGVAAALVEAGHQVHLVHGTRREAGTAVQRPSGARVHFVPAPWAYRAWVEAAWGGRGAAAGRAAGAVARWAWPAAPVAAAASVRLVRRVRSLSPDAVVLQDYESLRYDVLAPVLAAAGLQVVGLDTGGSARPSRAPWKPATRRLASCLLAAHRAEAERLRRAGHRRVHVWPPPVRTDLFDPDRRRRDEARSRLGVGAREPVVATAGRLHPVKQLPSLALACAEAGAVLVIAGEGPERGALEDLVAAGYPLRLLGQVDPEEIAWWYAASNVVALASSQEGQPLAVLEALSAGRAVVATAVGGVPEMVADGLTGWLVPPRDTAALAKVLADALSDLDEADRRGARGREQVVGIHSASAFAAWFAGVLEG